VIECDQSFLGFARIYTDHRQEEPCFLCSWLQLESTLKTIQALFSVVEMLVLLKAKLNPGSRVIWFFLNLKADEIISH